MNKKSIPFLVLSILHVGLLLFSFIKKGKQTARILPIGIGLTYIFEYFVLNLFNMYSYSPKVFKIKWVDSVFGAILSQAVYVPIAGTLLTLFKLGWKSRIAVALIFATIERLFIKLKIFKKQTWSTFYTITLMPFYFSLLNKWWKKLQDGSTPILLGSIFLYHWVFYLTLLFLSIALKGIFRFRSGLVGNIYQDHFIVVPIYSTVTSLIGTIYTTNSHKIIKFLGLIMAHIFDRILFKCKILKTSKKTNIYILLGIHTLIYVIGDYYGKLLTMMNRTEEE